MGFQASSDGVGVIMFPVNNLEGIEKQLKRMKKPQAVFLMFIKPSDENADEIISNFNYYHANSGDYCSIFAAGYCQGDFSGQYADARIVQALNTEEWWYSDQCFVEFKDQLSKRIKWRYCGEPELLILQNSERQTSCLDFSNYVSLDLFQGIRKSYFESIPRIMEALIEASKEEVESKLVLKAATRLSPKEIAHRSLQTILSYSKVPKPIKDLIEDRTFYRSANYKGW